MIFCYEKCWFLFTVIMSIFMLGIRIITVFKSELNGLHQNVQTIHSRCPGSRESIVRHLVVTVERDCVGLNLMNITYDTYD